MARLDKLKELEARLYAEMEGADARTLPQLARQYRETIREIEEIEGTHDEHDAIGDILSKRNAAGESNTVRPPRSGV